MMKTRAYKTLTILKNRMDFRTEILICVHTTNNAAIFLLKLILLFFFVWIKITILYLFVSQMVLALLVMQKYHLILFQLDVAIFFYCEWNQWMAYTASHTDCVTQYDDDDDDQPEKKSTKIFFSWMSNGCDEMKSKEGEMRKL